MQYNTILPEIDICVGRLNKLITLAAPTPVKNEAETLFETIKNSGTLQPTLTV